MGEKGELTDKHAGSMTTLQAEFVANYIANGFKDAKGAALQAGASPGTAKNAYLNFLGSPVVKAEIDAVRDMLREASRDRLLGVADKAVGAIEAVLDDKDALATAKISAAKAAIEMSGVSEPLQVEHTGKDGGPIEHEHSIIRALRDRLADRRGEASASDGGGEGSEAS